MADVLTDFSQASMANAVEANLFSLFENLAGWPRVELHDDGDCLWTLSDLKFPLFNSVMRTQVPDDRAAALVDARMAACRDRQVPMLWWTGPLTSPGGFGALLERRGFLLEPAHGMAADLLDVPVEQPPGDGATIERVDGFESLSAWSRVLCDAFGAPPAFGTAFEELAATVGLGPASPFRHFLLRADGAGVATSSVFLGSGVAGIYDVSTLPEWRRRGFGARITRAAIADAREHGYRIAILHSSTLGFSMYRSLGFEKVCEIGQYVWAPPC